MKNNPIGRYFGGFSIKHRKTCIYLCTKIDSGSVYVTNITDPDETLALSPRAIGRTFHPAAKEQPESNRWYIYYWATYVTV